MNLNLKAKKILCYGDSNTWGAKPITFSQRYPVDTRWTGLLQKMLGENYWVIEEGLNGRTTSIDDTKREGRNGKTYLRPCLESHNPLDIVIIMLGTNDFKTRFNHTVAQAAQGVGELVKIVKQFSRNERGEEPKITVVSPIPIDES